jgi:hypothetical protein
MLAAMQSVLCAVLTVVCCRRSGAVGAAVLSFWNEVYVYNRSR